MYNRDLGSLGETVFKGWCHSVGLTVHKSEMDRTGWDFFVEFPCENRDGLPRDVLPAPIECKVQVKATDKKKRKLPITVSNLDRLIKAPMPAFFCFIEFDGTDEVQAAYLVHVGKEIIEKTLKKIRELEIKGNGNELNKHTITVHYGEDNLLASKTGTSLKSAIQKNISDGMEKYIESKNHLLHTLGFENGKYQGTLTFSSDDPIRDLVDVTLGIREEIPLEKFAGYHKRFEFLSRNSDMDCGEGIFSIQVKPQKSVLEFKEYKSSPAIASFNADLYISPFNRFLPKNYIKLRVKSRFFEFLVEPFNKKVNCTFDPKIYEQISLVELKNFFTILKISKEPNISLHVELKSDDLPPALRSIVELEAEDLSQFFSKIDFEDEVCSYSKIDQLAEMAIFLCRQFQVQESDVLITINELVDHSRSIEGFYQILCADPKTVKIDFPAEAKEYQQYTRTACTSSIMATIGDHILGCFFGIVGSLDFVDGHRFRLVADKILTGHQFVLTESKIIDQKTIDENFYEFEKELQNKGLVTIRIK